MRFAILGFVAVLGLGLSAACGDDDGGKASSTPTIEATGTAGTASASPSGTAQATPTVQATSTPGPVQRPTYQASYSYLIRTSGQQGTMVIAQQPPLLAWWITVNNATTGWVTDGTHTTICSRGPSGPMTCQAAQDSGSGPAATAPSDAVNQVSQPGVKMLGTRTFAGRAGQCFELPGSPATTMCATVDGIMLLLDNAQTHIEATSVTDAVDQSLFKTN